MTPGLVIILLVIIVKCILDPIGVMNIKTENQIFLKGFAEGYQTMDALGAALMTGIVVSDLKRKGYLNEQERVKLVKWVGLVAFLLLAIIYGGLIYVGATASKIYTVQNTRVDILLGTVQHILGSTGKFAIGIAVSLACLTTSVGLSAVAGDFLSGITKNKLGYKPIVLATVFVSGLISLAGVEGLINAAVPILSTVYPIIMVLIFLGIFDKYIKYDMTFKGAVLATFVVSLVEVLNSKFKIFGSFAKLIKTLPFSSVGFEWLLPAIVTGAIFGLIAYIQDKRKIA